jgi:putative aminopeptidase FrvX
MPLPSIDTQFLIKFLVDLLNTPSPAGLADPAVMFTEQTLRSFPQLEFSHTRKGALVVHWEGAKEDSPRALTAHVDTLGAMVKEIKTNGRLKISKVGGLQLNGAESEGCWVITNSGEKVRGALLFEKASVHVHGSLVSETKRSEENMEVRLDARSNSVEETRALGLQVGDFICFDPRVEVTNGFVRSRFLDDKAGVAAIVASIKALHDAGLKPAQSVYFHFSNYEEVGHGGSSGIPHNVHELLTVDMAAVGEGQTSDEYNTTLCVKDSGGPYHHGLSQKLRMLAAQYGIPYKTDIYPYYGSDGEAFLRAGGDVAVALIGPGVDSSHNYERTHTDALVATANWISAYMLSE